MILGIDPGPEQSAWLFWESDKENIIDMGIEPNEKIFGVLSNPAMVVAIEMIQSFGMPVGKSIFNTVKWIGKFERQAEINKIPYQEIFRKDIKIHFCNNIRAKDSNIRQALIDRFGKPGTKKEPGKLYGIKKDLWSALALAVFLQDKKKEAKANEI